MAYTDKIVMHVTEPMRSNIEFLARRRRNDIERLLDTDKVVQKMTRAELHNYAEEIFILDSIIAEALQVGT